MGPSTVAEALYCSQCGALTAVDNLANFGPVVVCPFCRDLFAQRLREGLITPKIADHHYAGFWVRAVASLIDGIVIGTFNSILQIVFLQPLIAAMQAKSDAALTARMLAMTGILTLVSFLIDGLYQSLFIAKMGATPGKMALGLKVVRSDGSRVGFGRAVGRYLGKILDLFTACVGYLMVAWDSEKRGLHDMISDTRVVKRAS